MTSNQDEFYDSDNLNRLVNRKRGTLNDQKTGIDGTAAAEEQFTLDSLGNWSGYEVDSGGQTQLSQSRTHNKANEITAIGGSPNWADPNYDAAGNMTDMPEPNVPTSLFSCKYDAWNHLVEVKESGTTVSKYGYDGTGRRTTSQIYSGGSPQYTRHYYYSSGGAILEERKDSSSYAERQYVWGVNGRLVLRDRDTSQTPDGVWDERLFALQDGVRNVTALIDTSGSVVERYRYEAYGLAVVMDSSFATRSAGSSYDWKMRFQGACWDSETGLYYMLNRFHHPRLGRWVQRDPMGYVDGMNHYEYCRGLPTCYIDPLGLGIITSGTALALPPKDWFLDPLYFEPLDLDHHSSFDVVVGESTKPAAVSKETSEYSSSSYNLSYNHATFDMSSDYWDGYTSSSNQTMSDDWDFASSANDYLDGLALGAAPDTSWLWSEPSSSSASGNIADNIDPSVLAAAMQSNPEQALADIGGHDKYDNIIAAMQQNGESGWSIAGLVTLLTISDCIGVTGVYEGITGEDEYTLEQLSGGQRALRTGVGLAQLGCTAFGLESIATIGAGEVGAEAEVIHFTDSAGVQGITESGFIRAESYVTLPGEVEGLSASEVESVLEIAPGRGAFSTAVKVPQSLLRIPANGPVTSGGAIQYQLMNQIRWSGHFMPTVP